MVEFVAVDIDSRLAGEDVCKIIANAMPGFSWRRGSGDIEGEYISGDTATGEDVQCWVEAAPVGLAMSFRSSSLDEAAREKLVHFVLDDLIPRFGQAREVRRQ